MQLSRDFSEFFGPHHQERGLIQRRCGQWWNGLLLLIAANCNVFWDSLTFRDGSFAISAGSLSLLLNSLLPKFPSSGILPLSEPSPCSRRDSPLHPYSSNRTLHGSSLWRWTRRTPGWGRSCLNRRTLSCTRVLLILAVSLQQNVTMTSGTGSFWPSSWPWRSGDIGWREQHNHSSSGRITRIWSTCARLDVSIPGKPGSRNAKPDALSRQFSITGEESDAEPVLPAACVIGAISWEIESLIQEVQDTEPDPGTGPPGRLFIPSAVRSQVLKWAHTAHFSCHPGVLRTLSFLRRYFWWPAMAKDAKEYVSACSTCARNKSSNHPPPGLLQSLPTPARPWSHVSLDFITGLPPSAGKGG